MIDFPDTSLISWGEKQIPEISLIWFIVRTEHQDQSLNIAHKISLKGFQYANKTYIALWVRGLGAIYRIWFFKLG